jgi:excinuclease ABC subunit C
VTPELAATLKNLPDRPGVYLMKDRRGTVIYVGKAQSLRSRVRSYWQKDSPTDVHRIKSVIDRVADVEYTMTDSISEALLLEGNLIKRFQPAFNIRLKDDKSYPYIKITLADDFPRIERTRKLPQDGSRYFGPYASASSVDEAMNLVRRLFPFRTCTIDITDGERALARPCLLYHIKRCQGPCIEAISKADYRADIAQVELFLEGRQESVASALRKEMLEASERQEYERAAAVRDKVRAIERTMESQKMVAFARTDLDLLGLARRDNRAAVQLFVIRNGKAIGREVFLLEAPRETTDAEIVSGFLNQYYGRATSIPKDIAVPLALPDAADLEAFLTERRASLVATAREAGVAVSPSDIDLWVRTVDTAQARRRGPLGEVRLSVPRRGERRKLIDLATRNADEAIAREQARWLADEGKTLAALEELATALNLPGAPLRIECYDISNVQGSDSVGSMVVFEEGRPRPGEYRRFRIRTVIGPNDFASHQEVLRRRFRRAKAGDEGAEEALRWAMPDLVIIDGGKGQVSAAKEVLDDLGLHDLPLAGLAKEREELFLPGESTPVVLPPTSAALYLVQRLRDEAHRFAITYHRDLRSKRQTHSAFDDLPGVGPKRRRALLRVFGSAKRVRDAPVEQIAAVPGIGPALAERIKTTLES